MKVDISRIFLLMLIIGISYADLLDQPFSETTLYEFGIGSGASSWVDYDNDGFLDILISGNGNYFGEYYAKIYRNNDDKPFTKQTGIYLRSENPIWGDFDNDEDLDISSGGHRKPWAD